VAMKTPGQPAIHPKEHFHAAELQILDATKADYLPALSVASHMTWNTEEFPNLRLRHAGGGLRKPVDAGAMTEGKNNGKGMAKSSSPESTARIMTSRFIVGGWIWGPMLGIRVNPPSRRPHDGGTGTTATVNWCRRDRPRWGGMPTWIRT
jgi:hypothetical protein